MKNSEFTLGNIETMPGGKFVTCRFGDEEHGETYPPRTHRDVFRNAEWIGKITKSGNGPWTAFLSVFGIGKFNTEEEAFNAVVENYKNPEDIEDKYAINLL